MPPRPTAQTSEGPLPQTLCNDFFVIVPLFGDGVHPAPVESDDGPLIADSPDVAGTAPQSPMRNAGVAFRVADQAEPFQRTTVLPGS